MKIFSVKVEHCVKCPAFNWTCDSCNLKLEELGPIEMHEVVKNGGIHPDCPLPDHKEESNANDVCESCEREIKPDEKSGRTADDVLLCANCLAEIQVAP